MLNNSRIRDLLYTYWPMLLAILIVLPRLVAPEFGLFDDPAAISYSQGIESGDWSVLANDAESGRFRPLYWLQYAVAYMLAGPRPFWFYVVNSLVFVLLTGELIWLVRKMGGSPRQGWISGALFVLAGPVIENVYTLMKPELLQFALILGALLPFAAPAADPALPRLKVLFAILSAVLLLLATMAKETTLLVLPISLTWLVLAWFAFSAVAKKAELARWGAFFAASALAVAIYFGIRGQFPDVSLTGGTYSDNFEWDLTRFADSVIRWSGWLVRDFAWLAPLLLVPFLDVMDRRLKHRRLLVGAAIWTLAWILIYLPWEFTVEYYMLPVAIGVGIIGGTVLDSAVSRIRQKRRAAFAWLSLGLASVLWLTTLPNNYSNARQQLAVDAANSQMIQYLIIQADEVQDIVINIQQENEYVYEIRTFLQDVRDLDEISVEVFNPSEGLSPIPLLVASPFVRQQPLLAVRMGVVENTQIEWNQSLAAALGSQAEAVFEWEESFGLVLIDLPRLLCAALPERGYCAAERPFIDTREFRYGWQIYGLPGAQGR